MHVDLERLQLLAQRERQGFEWKKGLVPENRCVFLGDDGACRVYNSRPSACRKLSVISPPTECASEKGVPLPRIIPMAEILISATLNLADNEFASLPKMLMQALAKKNSAYIAL